MSVFAALTGFWDWKRSTEKGTQARRTVNAHAIDDDHGHCSGHRRDRRCVCAFWDEQATPALALVLTLAAAALTGLGGTIGGTLAYDYGFNVETAGDHPVWHPLGDRRLPRRQARGRTRGRRLGAHRELPNTG